MKESKRSENMLKMGKDEFINYLNNYDVEDNNEGHEPGVNFHTHHQFQPKVFTFEKKNDVFHNPEGRFSDKDTHHVKEVDLTKHVEVVGMPEANENHNSHCSY